MKTETKHYSEEIKNKADQWVTKNPDPEVRRMYGHYYRAFLAGYDASKESELLEENERQANGMRLLNSENETLRNQVCDMADRNTKAIDEYTAILHDQSVKLSSLESINAELVEALKAIVNIKTVSDIRSDNGGLVTCYQVPYNLIESAKSAIQKATNI